MEEKIDNPVSRKIVLDSVWNRMGDYLPEIHCHGNRFSLGARLPEKEHRKWIAHINGNPNFREMVKRGLEAIFSNHIFTGRSYLEIRWFPHGTSFETDGVNGCMVYVSSDSGNYEYSCHNIDNFEQASVLFIALSVYLPKLYFALEAFESGELDTKKFPALEKVITEKITLNQVPECKMTFDECIHKYTWLCGICTRNPNAFFIKENKDLERIGDKWEPEGGLPGKKLCPVCGANISSEKCPYCEN